MHMLRLACYGDDDLLGDIVEIRHATRGWPAYRTSSGEVPYPGGAAALVSEQEPCTSRLKGDTVMAVAVPLGEGEIGGGGPHLP
jgi:hypothetical protein